ncbi:MAG: aquaporin [Lactobacillaceae bacterium]|jgi:aquaporin Z|nr:aquaporin [Lactobacillaceae bacterium]
MRKYIAELLGTFVLVFVGCGTVTFASNAAGSVGVVLAFGLGLMISIYTFGPISGSHVNPAVTLGMLCSGRMSGKEAGKYIAAQFIGATLAALVILLIAKGMAGGYSATNGLGQNGYGVGYMRGFNVWSAILFEVIATYLFVRLILEVTASDIKTGGLIIGLALSALLILGLFVTGGSLNPARSFGPALVVGGKALSQVWLFLVAPSIGGALAGLCYKYSLKK